VADLPALPEPPPKEIVSKFETAIFSVGSLGAYGYAHYVAGLSYEEAAGVGTAAGTAAVAAKRVIQVLAVRIYRRTPRAKAARLRRAIERLRWFYRNLRMLADLGYLQSPRDQVMLAEVAGMLQEVEFGAVTDADLINEVVDRNLARYYSRIRKFRPRELPGE
jgi:hypothetical protein